jgi:hypothetical protein
MILAFLNIVWALVRIVIILVPSVLAMLPFLIATQYGGMTAGPGGDTIMLSSNAVLLNGARIALLTAEGLFWFFLFYTAGIITKVVAQIAVDISNVRRGKE